MCIYASNLSQMRVSMWCVYVSDLFHLACRSPAPFILLPTAGLHSFLRLSRTQTPITFTHLLQAVLQSRQVGGNHQRLSQPHGQCLERALVEGFTPQTWVSAYMAAFSQLLGEQLVVWHCLPSNRCAATSLFSQFCLYVLELIVRSSEFHTNHYPCR